MYAVDYPGLTSQPLSAVIRCESALQDFSFFLVNPELYYSDNFWLKRVPMAPIRGTITCLLTKRGREKQQRRKVLVAPTR